MLVVLILYLAIPNFNNPEKKKLLKTFLKKEKMLVTSIFSSSHSVLYPNKDRNSLLAAFGLLSTNTLDLDKSKVLSFGKD